MVRLDKEWEKHKASKPIKDQEIDFGKEINEGYEKINFKGKDISNINSIFKKSSGVYPTLKQEELLGLMEVQKNKMLIDSKNNDVVGMVGEYSKEISYFESLIEKINKLSEEDFKFLANEYLRFKEIKDEKDYEEEIKKLITNYYTKKELAKKFLEIQPLYYDKYKIWWFWDKKEYKWQVIDETDILNSVSELSEANTVKTKEKTEIIEALKQESRKLKPKEINKSWIQFKEWIIDINTGEKFKATAEYFVTNPIPHSLGESEETPKMDEIFGQWVGEENIKKLYEILAYCLLPDYPLHRIFCFIGGGMNGKSKFLELLRKFIGKDNSCSTELDTLLNSRFEITRLHKKLVCQMGETNFNEMNKTSILKKLSGGDLIGFEYKRKDPFEEINYAKILIATNNLPATTDKTIGFYRRWMIIDFPNQFSEKKDILSEVPKEEYNNLSLKCINILKELLKKRSFYNEGTIKDRIQKYEEKSNPIQKFIEEFFDSSDINGFVTKNSFSTKLNEWLKNNKFREMSDMVVTKWMRSRQFEENRKYIDWFEGEKLTKRLARVWLGLKIKEKI